MTPAHSPVRVMHVASGDLWAGAEAQVSALVTALARRPDFTVAAITLNEGELANRLRSAGAEVRVMPERRMHALSLYRRMVAFMREWKPDVVHTHRLKENVLGSLAAHAAKVPNCVRTAHGAPEFALPIWAMHRRLARSADRWVARHLQRYVVAVSDELANRLTGDLPGANIITVPNGVDPIELQEISEPAVKLEPGKIHVAFIGRLVPIKRVDVFLSAAADLIRRQQQIYRFHVIGDGPLRLPLERLAQSMGISGDCLFHGFQPDATRWLAAMQCLVLTSDHEGLPMTALEARALGVPVVAHAVGGLPDLLENDPECALVHDQNPRCHANAIQRCAIYREHKACRLEDRFQMAAVCDRFAAIYGDPIVNHPH